MYIIAIYKSILMAIIYQKLNLTPLINFLFLVNVFIAGGWGFLGIRKIILGVPAWKKLWKALL
jgi:hypothetical protein